MITRYSDIHWGLFDLRSRGGRNGKFCWSASHIFFCKPPTYILFFRWPPPSFENRMFSNKWSQDMVICTEGFSIWDPEGGAMENFVDLQYFFLQSPSDILFFSPTHFHFWKLCALKKIGRSLRKKIEPEVLQGKKSFLDITTPEDKRLMLRYS